MKIKINAFLNIEFCVKQRQQHRKSMAAVFRTYANICPVSFSIEFSRFTWTTFDIFDGLYSRLFVLFLLLFVLLSIKLWKNGDMANTSYGYLLSIVIYNLQMTACIVCTGTLKHTHFCYLKSILKHGRTTFTTTQLNSLYIKCQATIAHNEWNILSRSLQIVWNKFKVSFIIIFSIVMN